MGTCFRVFFSNTFDHRQTWGREGQTPRQVPPTAAAKAQPPSAPSAAAQEPARGPSGTQDDGPRLAPGRRHGLCSRQVSSPAAPHSPASARRSPASAREAPGEGRPRGVGGSARPRGPAAGRPGARLPRQADPQPGARPPPGRGALALPGPRRRRRRRGPGAAPAAAAAAREGGALGGGARARSGRAALFARRGAADPASPWQPPGAPGPVGTPSARVRTRRAAGTSRDPGLLCALRGDRDPKEAPTANTPLGLRLRPQREGKVGKGGKRGAEALARPGRCPLWLPTLDSPKAPRTFLLRS